MMKALPESGLQELISITNEAMKGVAPEEWHQTRIIAPMFKQTRHVESTTK